MCVYQTQRIKLNFDFLFFEINVILTKMTEEQFNHYIKGGYFLATYNPKVKHDLSSGSWEVIGKKIKVWQNMINSPLQGHYQGQHAFNADEVYGWFPEEDIEIHEILDEFKDNVQTLPQYMYRMVYTKRSQIKPNFGIGYEDIPLPFEVYREYSFETDSYVLGLSKPPATKVQKYIWTGKYNEEIKWEDLEIKQYEEE